PVPAVRLVWRESGFPREPRPAPEGATTVRRRRQPAAAIPRWTQAILRRPVAAVKEPDIRARHPAPRGIGDQSSTALILPVAGRPGRTFSLRPKEPRLGTPEEPPEAPSQSSPFWQGRNRYSPTPRAPMYFRGRVGPRILNPRSGAR